MDILLFQIPIFILIWSIAFPCYYFYLKDLKSKYDLAILPGCRIKVHWYQWTSKEIWEKSIGMESSLILKTSRVFTPIGVFTVFLLHSLKPFRLYLSVIAAIIFLMTFIILIKTITKIHKSFCSYKWYMTCYNDSKLRVKYLDNTLIK